MRRHVFALSATALALVLGTPSLAQAGQQSGLLGSQQQGSGGGQQ